MNGVVLTCYHGPAEILRDVTKPAMERYAERHGLDVVEAPRIEGYPATWCRIPALATALKYYDMATWLDGDVSSTPRAPEISTALGGHWQGFATDQVHGHNINFLWCMRSCPEAFELLAKAWEGRFKDEGLAVDQTHHLEGEQGVVRDLISECAYFREPWVETLGALAPEIYFNHASFQFGRWARRRESLVKLAEQQTQVADEAREDITAARLGR